MSISLLQRGAKVCILSSITGIRFLRSVLPYSPPITRQLTSSIRRSPNLFPLEARTPTFQRFVNTFAREMADLPRVPFSSYLGQEAAQLLDAELFTSYRFSLDQLMEIAGLSCAVAIREVYPPKSLEHKVLILCGPGNNGGDGLVCARHLTLFGYHVEVYYPRRSDKLLFPALVAQCEKFDVKLIDELPNAQQASDDYYILVDALFGFSFKPPVRELFLPAMSLLTSKSRPPICSIDVPSGWSIEGTPDDSCIKPEMLISLTAPKQCTAHFQGEYHYLAGRFVPQAIKDKYGLLLPEYPGSSCCQRIAS